MDENRISCPVGSGIASSLGRLVVRANLFSQPINIVESTTDDVTWSGSEEDPNMIPTLVTHDNPLPPSYNRSVQTYPNEQFDHRWHRDGPLSAPPPFTVFDYMDRFPNSIDAVCFQRMRTDSNELRIRL